MEPTDPPGDWPAPTSPEPLLQERPEVRGRPWRLLVVCALCNKTQGRLAWPVAEALFARWPDADALAGADPAELEALLRPIGLYRQRAASLVKLSRRWVEGGWTLEDLPAVGRYARDAWAIFVEGRDDVEPQDGHLGRYVAWRRATGTWAT